MRTAKGIEASTVNVRSIFRGRDEDRWWNEGVVLQASPVITGVVVSYKPTLATSTALELTFEFCVRLQAIAEVEVLISNQMITTASLPIQLRDVDWN